MNADHDNHFDAAVRAQHAISLERLSPRVRAQLSQRRNAALRGEHSTVAARGHGFRYASAAFAAVFALAIGIQLGPVHTNSGTPAVATTAATSQDRTGTTMLDEDPSFYAWLDSSDVRQLAME